MQVCGYGLEVGSGGEVKVAMGLCWGWVGGEGGKRGWAVGVGSGGGSRVRADVTVGVSVSVGVQAFVFRVGGLGVRLSRGMGIRVCALRYCR